MEKANSEEFDTQTADRVVIFMPEVWSSGLVSNFCCFMVIIIFTSMCRVQQHIWEAL